MSGGQTLTAVNQVDTWLVCSSFQAGVRFDGVLQPRAFWMILPHDWACSNHGLDIDGLGGQALELISQTGSGCPVSCICVPVIWMNVLRLVLCSLPRTSKHLKLD